MINSKPMRLEDRVLYIDAHVLVLDKPAGLAVHPGPRTPDSLERRLGHLRFGFQREPYPAHRLDRDTSGCLLFGRHPKALKALQRAFSEGRIDKTYWAWVAGAPNADEGRIDAPLAKTSSAEAGWRMVVDPSGQRAVTKWQVLERRPNRTLLELSPETGRTHQLRVHLEHLGCPIIGDPVYGATGISKEPLRLLARSIGWTLPEPHLVTAQPPEGWTAG
jgi:tRNA pseudouridine32 synthase / 23S rRNA pseudouridine746 synthase